MLIYRNFVQRCAINICGLHGGSYVNPAPEELAFLRDFIATERNDNILTRTRRLSRAVTEIYDARLQPFGISAVQFSLLEIIGRLQPITRAAIARNQELDKSTLTRNLKSISSEGWVEEVQERADGRSRPIALTKAGKQLLLDADSAWLAAQDEVKLLLQARFDRGAVPISPQAL